jgi:hypothetical protein
LDVCGGGNRLPHRVTWCIIRNVKISSFFACIYYTFSVMLIFFRGSLILSLVSFFGTSVILLSYTNYIYLSCILIILLQ